jgi:hypothetical protein
MSFRHKDKQESQENQQPTAEGDDVKVVHEKDSKQGQSSEQASAQQTTSQQAGQESGQPQAQTEEQSTPDEDEDDDSSAPTEPVPDGTTAEILHWVGEDRQRAQAALDKEQADDRPRGGLTGELKKILGK